MSGDKTFSSGVGAASTGIEVASSGTANTIGSIVELDASTESEANGIVVTVASVGVVAATNISFLLNILTGPASSEVSLIDGIHFGQDLSVSNFTRQAWFFPVNIPSGTRVSATCQTDTASADSVFVLCQFNSKSYSSQPGHQTITSVGHDTSTSNSTITVDAGGVANTKGSWATVLAAGSNPGFDGFSLSIGPNLNTAEANADFLIDIAKGASQTVVVENIFCSSTSTENRYQNDTFFPIKIEAGELISIRSQCTSIDATDRVRSIVFHGANTQQAVVSNVLTTVI
jgi:hypothetical protein